ncbi:major head protein, partial [Escherichia coli 5905]
MRRRQSTGL